MKKILLQVGHGGRTTGATGAPGEQVWNIAMVASLKELLKDKLDVTTVGADDWVDEVQEDYDLFLTIHYDADIYNDRGGFTGYPEPSTDYATKESQRISNEIGEYFFSNTGIPWKKARSTVRNIRYYYMWKYLSASTPCVIIEAGVGWRKPEDYEVLRKSTTPQILANSILLALGESENNMDSDCIEDFDPNEDIPGEIEDKFDPNLKSYPWYNKQKSWEWVIDFADDRYQDSLELKEDVEALNKMLLMKDREIDKLNAQLISKDDELVDAQNEIIRLDEQIDGLVKDLEDQSNELADAYTEIERLEKELSQCGATLCEIPSWERFKSLFTCAKGGE